MAVPLLEYVEWMSFFIQFLKENFTFQYLRVYFSIAVCKLQTCHMLVDLVPGGQYQYLSSDVHRVVVVKKASAAIFKHLISTPGSTGSPEEINNVKLPYRWLSTEKTTELNTRKCRSRSSRRGLNITHKNRTMDYSSSSWSFELPSGLTDCLTHSDTSIRCCKPNTGVQGYLI